MKINGTGNPFYGCGTSAATGKKTGASALRPSGVKSDQVTLSKQVLAVVQMQNRLKAVEQARENAEQSPEGQMLDSMRKTLEIMKTCGKIAARIRAGDRVPLKDLRYLMKHDIRSYQLAMAARKPKEDPKKWQSAVPKDAEQEEQTGNCVGEPMSGGTTPAGCADAAGTTSDGGTGSGGEGT